MESVFGVLHPVSSEGTATFRFEALGGARAVGTPQEKEVETKYRLKSVTVANVPVFCEAFVGTEGIKTQRILPSVTIPINKVEKVYWSTFHWEPRSSLLLKHQIEPVPGYTAGALTVEGRLAKGRMLHLYFDAQLTTGDESTLCFIQSQTPEPYRLPL
jgi:hypothetical protein